MIYNNKSAKTVAKMAEGQVMIYHKRLAINFNCVPKISRSGLPLALASMW